MTQMEQWSILSNTLNYIQYDRHPKTYHSLSINAINEYKINIKEKGNTVELKFWCHTRGIKRRISGCV